MTQNTLPNCKLVMSSLNIDRLIIQNHFKEILLFGEEIRKKDDGNIF